MCFEGCDPRVRTQKRESTTARSQKSAACCAPRATYSRRSRTSFPTTNLPPSPRADPPPARALPWRQPGSSIDPLVADERTDSTNHRRRWFEDGDLPMTARLLSVCLSEERGRARR
jgi:hypothetical protein